MARAKAKAKKKSAAKKRKPAAKAKPAAKKAKPAAKKKETKKTGDRQPATGNRQRKTKSAAPAPKKDSPWPDSVRPKPETFRKKPEARGPRPPAKTEPRPLAAAESVFPEWQPYPKLRRAQLSDAQIAWLEQALASGRGYDLQYNGLFYKPEHNRRFFLGPPGPSDVQVKVGMEMVPLWNAVSDVASGHADPAAVLAAFRALPPNAALAAWEEIARGDAYDLHEAHALGFDEADIPRTKNNVAHRTRFFGWMADASVALGDAGRRAAEAIAASARTDRHGTPQAFIALLALTRHSRGVLDSKYDVLVATLEGEGAVAFAAPVVQEIYDAIPEDRGAWLPPIRQ